MKSTPSTAAEAAIPGHPRLLVQQHDLARLRRWAQPDNAVYAKGLAVLAATAKAAMDEGHVPDDDTGSAAYDQYPSESYAESYAFMSLIDADAKARDDWGRRARTLLMSVIKEAAEGAAENQRFREPNFSFFDGRAGRARPSGSRSTGPTRTSPRPTKSRYAKSSSGGRASSTPRSR